MAEKVSDSGSGFSFGEDSVESLELVSVVVVLGSVSCDASVAFVAFVGCVKDVEVLKKKGFLFELGDDRNKSHL